LAAVVLNFEDAALVNAHAIHLERIT